MISITPFSLLAAVMMSQDSAPANPTPWQSDAQALLAELRAKHPRPDHYSSWPSLEQVAGEVTGPPTMARLLAMVGDGHSFMPMFDVPKTNLPHGPTKLVLPLRFEWFDDGLFIVGTDSAHADLLGRKVEAIGKLGAEAALGKAMELLPHATPGLAAEFAPEWLMSDQVLAYLGALDGESKVVVRLGDTFHKVALVEPNKPFDWLVSKTDGPVADWKAERIDSRYAPGIWHQVGRHHYLRLVELRDNDKPAWEAVVRGLSAAAAQPTGNVVIDIRDCPGGNGDLVPQLVEAVKGSAAERERRLYLAIGRRSFSACVMLTSAFRRQTDAILVGQPTADGANHYGETTLFVLPNSGLPVVHSGKYWQTGDPADRSNRIAPDRAYPYRHSDFANGADPLIAELLQGD